MTETADNTVGGEPIRAEEIEAIPVRHPWRWAAAGVIGFLAVVIVQSVASNPRFEWGTVAEYFLSGKVIHGLFVTLLLTVIAMVVGIALGTVLAVMRLSPNPLISSASWTFIWLFRGTPLLVQLLFWNFVSALYPSISLGIPFGGPVFIEGSANTLITPFIAAILALGLNEAAYMSEIVRAGIISIDEGQIEASQSLGMNRLQTMRRIVLPQAMRVIIPPTGNETISMLKNTALVSVIAYQELLYSVQLIYAATYQQIPLLIVASIWYLIVTTVLSIGQYYVERHFGRASNRRENTRSGFLQILINQLKPLRR